MREPRKYVFWYKFNLKLKNGTVFTRTGELKGFSISNIKDQIRENNKNIVGSIKVEAIIDGLAGPDAMFYNEFTAIKTDIKIN